MAMCAVPRPLCRGRSEKSAGTGPSTAAAALHNAAASSAPVGAVAAAAQEARTGGRLIAAPTNSFATQCVGANAFIARIRRRRVCQAGTHRRRGQKAGMRRILALRERFSAAGVAVFLPGW